MSDDYKCWSPRSTGAAGLLGQLGASSTITKIRKYSLDLYKDLEKTTGLSTGMKQNGAITVASTKERMQELLRQATTAQLSDVEVEVLNKKRLKELYPSKIFINVPFMTSTLH